MKLNLNQIIVGAHLITKPTAHMGFVLEATCSEQDGSRWQNIYAKIPLQLCDELSDRKLVDEADTQIK